MADYDDALIERAEEAHWRAWSFNAAEKAGIRDPQSHNALMVRAVLDAVADDLRDHCHVELQARVDQAEAERDEVKTANTAVRVAAERAARKGYDLDPHEVLDLLGGDDR